MTPRAGRNTSSDGVAKPDISARTLGKCLATAPTVDISITDCMVQLSHLLMRTAYPEHDTSGTLCNAVVTNVSQNSLLHCSSVLVNKTYPRKLADFLNINILERVAKTCKD
ncbi:MAG TPA: hypothetical protein VGC15_11580 [Acetobacteraceae bacterium]